MPQGDDPLATVRLFAGLDHEERGAIARRCRFRRFRAGETLLRRGDPAGEVLFLLEGRLEVIESGPSGRGVVLATVKAGGHVGELAALDGGPRTADVVAATDGRLASLDRAGFLALLERHPRLALGAAGLLGRPKPARLEWLRAVPEAEVLASHIAEGEAIWLWLALPGRREPFALELPWDLRTARALVEARQRAEELGTGLLVRRPLRSSPDDREPMFHPLPQPPLPPKTVPSPAGPAAARMPPER